MFTNAAGTTLTHAQLLALTDTPPVTEATFTADVYEETQYEGSAQTSRTIKWHNGETVSLREIEDEYGLPTVAAIAPAGGAAAGGTPVTITGTHFNRGREFVPGGDVAERADVASVTVGGVACTAVVVVSDTEITAVTGAHAAGAGDVIVTTPAGASAPLAGGFTFA
jgi:large repetitive protein